MFDIGFAELIIIGVVALLVIGPERLPEAIRTGSAWLNRLRRGFNDIKQEVQQELHNDAVLRDLRESGEKLQEETQRLKQQFNTELGADAFDAVPREPSPSATDSSNEKIDSATETAAASADSDEASQGQSAQDQEVAQENQEEGEEKEPREKRETQAAEENSGPPRD